MFKQNFKLGGEQQRSFGVCALLVVFGKGRSASGLRQRPGGLWPVKQSVWAALDVGVSPGRG